jgi:hypothetical protein
MSKTKPSTLGSIWEHQVRKFMRSILVETIRSKKILVETGVEMWITDREGAERGGKVDVWESEETMILAKRRTGYQTKALIPYQIIREREIQREKREETF